MIELQKGHRYLFKSVSYSNYHDITEYHVIEMTDKSLKLKDIINNYTLWLDRDLIKDKLFGKEGYVISEDLGIYIDDDTDKKVL